jgi:hypothetical protein
LVLFIQTGNYPNGQIKTVNHLTNQLKTGIFRRLKFRQYLFNFRSSPWLTQSLLRSAHYNLKRAANTMQAVAQ